MDWWIGGLVDWWIGGLVLGWVGDFLKPLHLNHAAYLVVLLLVFMA
jgi:hypothetical protein